MICFSIVSHYYKGKTVCFPITKDKNNIIYCDGYAPIGYKVLVDINLNKIIKIGKDIKDNTDDDELLIYMYSLNEYDMKMNTVDPYNRKNLEKLFTITIDPEGSKDLDDALSISNNKFYVHIADVTSYLCISDIDNILKRGNTFYLRNCNVPLISREYSDDIISLLPGKIKRAITLEFNLQSGKFINWYPSLIKNDYQLSYQDVDSILDSERKMYDNKIIETVLNLKDFYNNIKRIDRIDINNNSFSHKMIEEFMINANKSIAEILNNSLYRHHNVPYNNKAGYIQRFLGYQLNKQISINIYDLNYNMGILPQKNTMSYLTKHMMSKAVYSIENKNHWALNEKNYTHFTSPIRRASDIIVHFDLLKGTNYLNEKEKYIKYLNDSEDIQTNIEFILSELDKRRNTKINMNYAGCIIKINTKGIDCYIPELDNIYTIHISECSKNSEYLKYIDGELKSSNFHYYLGKCVLLNLIDFNIKTGKYKFLLTDLEISKNIL